ncbi:uracil-DNA glycosylase [Caulobacter sp. S45]|uniref:uracil-DNA glycosylase n=1 Tax=Caulobacter sp. S45 TaxID=1641861 RepID=UPI001576DFE1|nr:uracil-DNA glycosylase [Caulobacter sp. S45]
MTPAAPHPLSGLLAFWAEAGVEFAYDDAPVDRLAEGARRLAPKPPPPAVNAKPAAPSRTPLAAHDAEAFDLAKAAAARAIDLPALEAAVAAFPWGGLKARAARTVFARGPANAPVMLIGEGPGAEEDQSGEPFVGRSGQLLERILAAGGLEGRVFITNTVFWRPSADRTPSQAEQAMCLPFVERAIALVKPRILLLAGGASAKHMLRRSEGILSLRGRWFDWTPEGGGEPIPALPILHPAFLLRQPAAKAHAWQDVLTLLSRLDRST